MPIKELTEGQKAKRLKRNPQEAEMIEQYRRGLTLQAIGEKYGVSRERVRQVMRYHGVPSRDGGNSVRAAARRAIWGELMASGVSAGEACEVVGYTHGTSNYVMTPEQKEARQAAKFWKQVDIGEAHECWLWTGLVHCVTGYGVCHLLFGEVRPRYAHRIAHLLSGNMLASGTRKMSIRHTCGNKLCCNPAHLVQGRHRDAIRAAMARGSRRTGARCPAEGCGRLASSCQRAAHKSHEELERLRATWRKDNARWRARRSGKIPLD